MKRIFNSVCLWGAAAVLVGAVCVQAVARAQREKLAAPFRSGQLASLMPASVRGGEVRDEAIAATEEMKRAVAEMLNYDDALFRIYRTPSSVVSVYIARWNAGKMAPRLVATHTPDVCWPGNGWSPRPMSAATLTSLSAVLDESGFLDGEARVFVGREREEYVLFWHKVGNDVVSYRNHSAPPRWAWIYEFWRYGLSPPEEQLFVRVSANIPLVDLWRRPEFEPVRTALLAMGLRRASQ